MLALGGVAGATSPTLASLTTTVAGPSSSALWPVWAAAPGDAIAPTLSAITPALAPNDIDAPVTITGAGFAASPTASLGGTPLTNVTFVSSTTLTATVPWGMNPGVYALKVINPGGGSASLADAFNVTQGIGQWNGGDLFGGDVTPLLMKPGDPNTLYALAYRVGLFRSRDAAEHWTYVSSDLGIGNPKLAIDPLHPDWLYAVTYKGLQRSHDEGDTWTTVMPNAWPDGRPLGVAQVYPSPSGPSGALRQFLLRAAQWRLSRLRRRSAQVDRWWSIVAERRRLGRRRVEDVAFAPAIPCRWYW